MQAKRLDVRVFASRADGVKLADLIPVFHGFIQKKTIEDELLIDVADYSHVVDGPGVLLVGHEAQYGFEQSQGRMSLLYSQRRANVDGFEAALRYSLLHALRAASLLQNEDSLRGKLRFGGQEIGVRINDRLAAPNTPETWKQVEPAARKVLGAVLGNDLSLEPAPPNGGLFTLHAKAASPASIDTLISRLS